jgi:hypothetical protein
MGNEGVLIMCYADEAVIIAGNEDNAQRLLYQLFLSSQKYNMKISVSKTKPVTLCGHPLRCGREPQGKVVEQIISINPLKHHLL